MYILILRAFFEKFLPAGLRTAQSCWYCIYSVVQKLVFRPAGATHCSDQISRSSEQKCGNTAPKVFKISNFAHKFALNFAHKFAP